MSNAPPSSACRQERGSTVWAGQIGQSRVRILARNSLFEESPIGSMALAGGLVAYARPIGHSHTDKQVVIAAPGVQPTRVPGMTLDGALAFDGRVLATAHDDTVQLAAIRG